MYSLCLAHTRGYYSNIFEMVKTQDLDTMESIPIKLWRYGVWKTIHVEPSLLTQQTRIFTEKEKVSLLKKSRQVVFTHSDNENIFWSALLQKAYYM